MIPRASIVRFSSSAAALLLVAAIAGCGGKKGTAPVSGTITLDGKPVEAVINFQPIGGEGNANPGPAANGRSDASGHYDLKTIKGDAGATVGKNRVVINSPRPAMDGSIDSGAAQPKYKNLIPAKYNEATELTFEVPAGGSTTADFPLKSK